MSIKREYSDIGKIYSVRDSGYLKGNITANFNLFKDIDGKVVFEVYSIADKEVIAKVRYSFLIISTHLNICIVHNYIDRC